MAYPLLLDKVVRSPAEPANGGGAPASALEDDAAFYARVIRRLGRNARPDTAVLEPGDMARLWHLLLAELLTPSQEAAALMGLRVHGESAPMLAACAQQTAAFCAPLAGVPGRAVVVLNCLGTARRQPILAPLLALRLAARDVPVLLITHDAARGPNTAAVLDALQFEAAADAGGADAQLATTRLAWLPVQALCPALARVLARRAELGFRSTAQSSIKLLAPMPRAVLVANYTHAPYRATFGAAVESLGHTALLVRGTEGDPIAWEAAAHPSLAWWRGAPAALGDDGRERDESKVGESPGEAPGDGLAQAELPSPADVVATARYIERAHRLGVAPAPIERQAQQLHALARREDRA